ncbi:hypothetical protein [Nocardia gipuzkoensis]|uniref:hypothetical protein n=1 Tax=Nocardia gipuzkoensis TaxID=2749991 RepID=UPI00237E033F|nr:hypothetical protein [Nocardia gipuzkoensis]MDE1675443.1 hypothetical protein [Nocardia gipuzkoensis]
MSVSLVPHDFWLRPTTHRRFTAWTKIGLGRQPHRAVLDKLGSEGFIDLSRAVIGGAGASKERDDMTG